MINKLVASSLIGASTIGGVAGVGIWYSRPKDLRDLLIKERKQLLDVYGNTNDAEWQKLADKYKGSETTIILEGDKQVNKIEDFKIDATDNDGFAKLKGKCKELFEKKISDKEDFKTAKQHAIDWCIKESDTLTKELKTTQVSPRTEADTGQMGRANNVVQSQTLNPSPSGRQGATDSDPSPSN